MNEGMIKEIKLQKSITLLLKLAQGDSGGSRKCAMFLLSLWNGDDFKADLQELLYNDAEIFYSMISIFEYLYKSNNQLDCLVTQADINPIITLWGKSFMQNQDETE